MNIDKLIDNCATIGKIDGGEITVFKQKNAIGRPWTSDEINYIRENIGVTPYSEISKHLGRTEQAIKIKQVREQIHAPSKREGYLTGNQVAKLFRVDIHAVMTWHERNIMDMQVVPGERGILNVHINTVYRWAVQSKNWIYFRKERIMDAHLKRLVYRAFELWGDEWWTIGQAAEYYGVDSRTVRNHIVKGSLYGIQWGNWYLKKSDVVNYIITKGKGSRKKIQNSETFSLRTDEWIIKARKLGMTWKQISIRTKRYSENQIRYRYFQLN